MNWKFWTWRRREDENMETLLGWIRELQDALDEERKKGDEVAQIMERMRQPVGEIEKAQAKLREGLGAVSETHPTWQAITLFIEWQRREAHADTMAPFTSDREAWIAIGREQGIERLQLSLVRAFVQNRNAEGQGRQN